MVKPVVSIVVLGALLIAGCDSKSNTATNLQTSVPTDHFDTAEKIVSDDLRDPSSAQFRRERTLPDGVTVCGEVNSKNAFGGYAGFTAYFANTATAAHGVYQEDADGAPDFVIMMTWPEECLPDGVREIAHHMKDIHNEPADLENNQAGETAEDNSAETNGP